MRRLDCGYALSAKYALRKYQNKMELFYVTWYYEYIWKNSLQSDSFIVTFIIRSRIYTILFKNNIKTGVSCIFEKY